MGVTQAKHKECREIDVRDRLRLHWIEIEKQIGIVKPIATGIARPIGRRSCSRDSLRLCIETEIR
jgi:hypothetical protein